MLKNISFQTDHFAGSLIRVEAEIRRRERVRAMLTVAALVALAALSNG